MSKLEVKDQMSPVQFAVVLISVMLGSQVVPGARDVVEQAEQSAWLSVMLGGMLTFAAAFIMVKLGLLYPDETFAEYVPNIVGRRTALLLLACLGLVLLLQQIFSLRVFLGAIVFYMRLLHN